MPKKLPRPLPKSDVKVLIEFDGAKLGYLNHKLHKRKYKFCMFELSYKMVLHLSFILKQQSFDRLLFQGFQKMILLGNKFLDGNLAFEF